MDCFFKKTDIEAILSQLYPENDTIYFDNTNNKLMVMKKETMMNEQTFRYKILFECSVKYMTVEDITFVKLIWSDKVLTIEESNKIEIAKGILGIS